jgi:hypothetical protein
MFVKIRLSIPDFLLSSRFLYYICNVLLKVFGRLQTLRIVIGHETIYLYIKALLLTYLQEASDLSS